MPTATDLKARFPEFTPVADALVTLVLAEAVQDVDTSWDEDVRPRAQLYLAAHYLAMQGEPGRSASSGMSGDDGGVDIGAVISSGIVKNVQVGDVKIELSSSFTAGNGSGGSAGGDVSEFAATAYGRMYLTLLRRQKTAVYAV